MRILAFSDIHGAIPAVEQLVEREANKFDLTLVAGDIGPDPTSFFRTLESLGCPVMYVYGNWDGKLEYDIKFHERFSHLHGEAFLAGELLFAGYSGCDMQWGRNPFWQQRRADLQHAHRGVLNRVSAAVARDSAEYDAIDKRLDAEIDDIKRRARDRRRRSYKDRLAAVERRRDWHKNRCGRAAGVRETKAFRAYNEAYRQAWSGVNAENRADVVKRILDSGVDPAHCVLVTHERLYRLHEDCPVLGAHLFGHRHGFKLSRKQGTTFVNVSSLDPWSLSGPQYAVLEWTQAFGFLVQERQLPGGSALRIRCLEHRKRSYSTDNAEVAVE